MHNSTLLCTWAQSRSSEVAQFLVHVAAACGHVAVMHQLCEELGLTLPFAMLAAEIGDGIEAVASVICAKVLLDASAALDVDGEGKLYLTARMCRVVA